MFSIHRPAYAALTLPLLLMAACNQQATVQPSSSTALSGSPLVSVVLSAPLGTVTALHTQGIPFADDGTPIVQHVHVRVFDEAGQPVRFDDANTQTASGTHAYVDLTPSQNACTLLLSPGKYSFQAAGLDDSSGSPLLAFGRLDNKVISGNDTSILLPLRTLIGKTDKVVLQTALPMNYVMPGQVFDVNLLVSTAASGGKSYPVPLSDFSASYALTNTGDTLLAFSPLGARVKAGTTSSTFGLSAKVTGLSLGDVLEQEAVVPNEQVFTPQLNLPVYSTVQLGADLERPVVHVLNFGSFNEPLGTVVVGERSFLTGFVSDNVGVAAVRIYNGVQLISSSDAGEYGQNGVSQVTFDSSGNWTGTFTPPTTGSFSLLVVATDTSGNEIRVPFGVYASAKSPLAPGLFVVDETSLNIYHLHSAPLHVIFEHFPVGPVQLALVRADFPVDNSAAALPLVIQTNPITIAPGPSQRQDVVISAPNEPDRIRTPISQYRLQASVSGTVIATSDLLTLKELPTNFTVAYSPNSLTGHAGDQVQATVTVTADPPLDGPAPISVSEFSTTGTPFSPIFSEILVGPTTGTGSTMQSTVVFRLSTASRDAYLVTNVRGARLGGYRDEFYGGLGSKVTVNVIK